MHCFPAAEQEALLQRCGKKLNTGGTIIIRDGIEDEKQKHGVTRVMEVFSITLFSFNKAEHGIIFPTEQRMLAFASRYGLRAERQGNKVSSNVVWVFRKKGTEPQGHGNLS